MRQIGDAYVAANAVVAGDVVLSPGANVWFNCVIRGDLARITLGPRANVQDGTIIHVDHDQPQVIEEGVVVGHAALQHGRVIGKDTLVGMGAILLSGTEIDPECLIAAGTLITEGRRIPARSVVMGVPGKVVREVTDEDLRRILDTSAHYLEMAQRYARGAFAPPWEGAKP